MDFERDAELPSLQFREALRTLGIPDKWHGREALIELIRESMDWRSAHEGRTTNALAQIVLVLARERNLRVPVPPIPPLPAESGGARHG